MQKNICRRKPKLHKNTTQLYQASGCKQNCAQQGPPPTLNLQTIPGERPERVSPYESGGYSPLKTNKGEWGS